MTHPKGIWITKVVLDPVAPYALLHVAPLAGRVD
jgi:hypothetical protein